MALVTSGLSYDVFLSFRGEDTRHGFTGNLWKALNDRGIRTFMDDEELQEGEEITPSLVKAVEESKIAIVVLSNNYASSSFCLQELAKILDCSIKEKGLTVLPVFYDVDPSGVRNLMGTYGEAMAMHEARCSDNMDKTLQQEWKMALHRVANMPGFHFNDRVGYDEFGYEFDLIVRIVEKVVRKLNCAPYVTNFSVGLDSPLLEQVCSLLLELEYDEVLTVGNHGMAGKAKTTLAQAVYNRIAHQFDGSCFLGNVRENSNKHGLVYLQNMLLSEIVGERDILQLGNNANEGVSIIKRMLQQKKVLLILDDVDTLEQLEALVGEPNWFGSGSRIIITTLDRHLLTFHGIERTYELQELNHREERYLSLPQAPQDSIFTTFPNRTKHFICRLPAYMAFCLRDDYFSPPKMKDLITKNLRFVSPKLAELLKTFPSVLDSVLQISRGRLPEALQILPSVSEVALQISPSSLEVLQISQWDCQDETKWRLVGLVSSVVGLLCYALSPSFNHEFGGWNSLKFILYGVLSLVICTTILFAKKTLLSTQYVQLRSYISFAVLMIISVYSFYYDKAVDGKPETLSLVSNAAFALVSLSLSKLVQLGFEMGIFSYFLGCLVVQLWTIDWKLILVAIIFGCPLFRMHSPSNSRREVYSSLNSEPEVDSAQVFNSLSSDSDPEVRGGRHHVIHIHT